MSDTVFLIDTSVLITPKRIFYPFDLALGFWKQMKQANQDG